LASMLSVPWFSNVPMIDAEPVTCTVPRLVKEVARTAALSTLTLVVPAHTTTTVGPVFSMSQLVFAGVMGLRPRLALMGVPSLSQHFLITSLLRDERVPAAYLALSVTATLILGALLIAVAGRLYRREALLG